MMARRMELAWDIARGVAVIVAMFWLTVLPADSSHSKLLAASFTTQRSESAQKPLSASEIFEQRSPSVVTINTSGGIGSGVIIDPSGIIVTSLHVVRGESEAEIQLSNGDIYDAVTVINVDERKDIVLLKLEAYGLTSAPLGNSEMVRTGETVTLIGSPEGLDLTVSTGIVSSIRDSGEGYRLIQTTAAASSGSSGGGMFNEFGELIGIVTSKIMEAENITFAIPVNYVRGLTSNSSPMTLADLARRFPDDESAADSAPASTTTTAQAASLDDSILAMVALLQASGLDYRKSGDDSWAVAYEGTLETVDVYIRLYGDYALFQSVVELSPQMSSERASEILKMNFTYDLAKVAIDEEGDLVVLQEIELRLLDAQALERITDNVAFLADRVVTMSSATPQLETGTNMSFPANATGYDSLELLRGRMRIQYAPSEWRPEDTDEPGEYQFGHTSGDLYIRLISERIEISLDNLLKIALDNAREVDPKVRETRRGERFVNGRQMRFLEFEATVDSMALAFYGHYYSDDSGTVQILGFTARNLMVESREAIESFVSGFDVIQE